MPTPASLRKGLEEDNAHSVSRAGTVTQTHASRTLPAQEASGAWDLRVVLAIFEISVCPILQLSELRPREVRGGDTTNVRWASLSYKSRRCLKGVWGARPAQASVGGFCSSSGLTTCYMFIETKRGFYGTTLPASQPACSPFRAQSVFGDILYATGFHENLENFRAGQLCMPSVPQTLPSQDLLPPSPVG